MFVYFLEIFYNIFLNFFLSILMVFRTDEGQPNIYFFILQRFGPYHRHRILKPSLLLTILSDTKTEWTLVTSEYRCTESVEILRCHLLYLITYLAWSIYKTDWLTLCTGRGFTLLIGWIYKLVGMPTKRTNGITVNLRTKWTAHPCNNKSFW